MRVASVRVVVALAATVATLLAAPSGRAASPSSGSLQAPGDAVTWNGGPFTTSNPNNQTDPCADPAAPGCDRYKINVAPQAGATTLTVTVSTADGVRDDYDLYVYAPNGARVGTSASNGTPPGGESVAIGRPTAGTYEVRVQAFTVAPGSTYQGRAALVQGGGDTFDPEGQDCTEFVPARAAVAGVTDSGQRVSLDVTVLLDEGVSEPRARGVMTAAKRSYTPLAIDLNVTRYVRVAIPSDGSVVQRGVTVGTALGDDVIAFSQALFGGKRPPDSDVVYTITNKDLYSGSPSSRDYSLAGLADCIGGVRFDQRAFAIGELGPEAATSVGGVVTTNGNFGAKVASHEIGHLMGAHHHYFNCAEGLAEETADKREASPCTVMAPVINFASINFGVGDGAAVRGHAVGFAANNDALAAPARAATERASAGYALLGEDGGIFTFGGAGFYGSTGDRKLNQPVVGMAWTPSGSGYWVVAKDGGIFTFGDAQFLGSTGGMALNAPILGMEATPSGRGYWLVAADGGIFTFGDAGFFGSTGDKRLNQPVVDLGTTSTGKGYWLVAKDGGIFTFGDAGFFGSTGDIRLNQPIFGIEPTGNNAGYWLVARDGGVFTFGSAVFHGSAAGRLGGDAVGLASTVSDGGYWVADRRGSVFPFGNAPVLGDLAGRPVNAPIVGFTASP